MKVQFKILLFIVCLNLATGMVIELSLPGTEYVTPSNPSNRTEYEEHFNATETVEGWQATPFSGIPVVGDIFSGLQMFWRCMQYLIAGFPLFLVWIGDSFIIDASARLAYDVIVGVLIGIQAILMTVFALEYISGRYMTH